MSNRQLENKIVQGKKLWKNTETDETLETVTVVQRRIGDPDFIKLFPLFFHLILDAVKTKKIEGSMDVMVYFLSQLQDLPVNGFGRQLDIRVTAEEVAEALAKSIRKVRKSFNILISLGLIAQPKPGVYQVHPSIAYRGVLKKYERQVELEHVPKKPVNEGEAMTMKQVQDRMKNREKHPDTPSSSAPGAARKAD